MPEKPASPAHLRLVAYDVVLDAAQDGCLAAQDVALHERLHPVCEQARHLHGHVLPAQVGHAGHVASQLLHLAHLGPGQLCLLVSRDCEEQVWDLDVVHNGQQVLQGASVVGRGAWHGRGHHLLGDGLDDVLAGGSGAAGLLPLDAAEQRGLADAGHQGRHSMDLAAAAQVTAAAAKVCGCVSGWMLAEAL